MGATPPPLLNTLAIVDRRLRISEYREAVERSRKTFERDRQGELLCVHALRFYLERGTGFQGDDRFCVEVERNEAAARQAGRKP